MDDPRRAVGQFGEAVAQRFLRDQGFEILETNWRSRDPRGELDIVARDRTGDVVVVEVKTRRTLVVGEPVTGVTPRKLIRLRRLAARWLRDHPQPGAPGVRVDVIGILIGTGSAPTRVDHLIGVV